MPADIAVRASDAERESAALRLAEQFTVGRLGLAEYDERVAAAYAATTVGRSGYSARGAWSCSSAR